MSLGGAKRRHVVVCGRLLALGFATYCSATKSSARSRVS